jgi:hypothetical protein
VTRFIVVLGTFIIGAGQLRAQADSGRTVRTRSYSFASQEGWLGMGLSCSRCSYQRSGTSGGRWTFSEAPSVFSVDANGPADRAGLRGGDTLVSIDGLVLVSREGGEAFGRVRPGQEVTIRFRRDGRETDARLVAGTRPYQAAEAAMADRLREIARAQARQSEQRQRWMEQSQRGLERQREYMQRAIEQMRRAEEQLSDSTRLEAVQRSLTMLDSAAARWRAAESLYAQAPPVAAAAPVAPVAPLAPVAPVAAAAAIAPAAPPRTYAEHREFGPLRYSGRLGDAVIEARSPTAVTTTEVTDSEVVVTSRDLSVRIAIRPRVVLPKRAIPAQPARPPRE